ncbi:MAG: PD-(D/E)XK nuclease family protein [Clostridia bacterium]|nr:PD-(D/E)XK nuclease family protein [Clostridia bacterium]
MAEFELILGMPGSGKTEKIKRSIKYDLELGREVILIVPGDSTLTTETEFSSLLDPSFQLTFTATDFKKLSNLVFRKYGGVSHKYLTDGMRNCLMWRAIAESGDLRSLDRLQGDSAFIELMLSAGDELKRNGITPEMLSQAAEETGSELSAKLMDISDLTSAYDSLLHGIGSDPADDESKLAAVLRERPFFSGKAVYIDSFQKFTPNRISIISSIIAQAEKTVVTLTCDEGGLSRGIPSAPQFKNAYSSAAALRAAARKSGVKCSELFLHDCKRQISPELRFLAENLWIPGAGKWKSSPADIRIWECTDRYSEAERTAADICRLVREKGLRYRDIAVVARDISLYEGIIDDTFDKFGIPAYMSKKTDIMSKPPVKIIFAVFSVISYGWKREDVLTYLKTGLAGIGPDECDEFSIYCEKWNISGTGFSGEIEWSMNPAGLKDKMSENEADALLRINSVRERMRAPIVRLEDSMKEGPTVESACRALFGFLTEIGIRNILEQYVERDRAEGRLADAAETAQLWNIIIDSLDRLISVCGPKRVTTAEFVSLLSLMFSRTSVGSIPQTSDAVMIISVPMLSTLDRKKAAYVIGCERGVFPSVVKSPSVFTDIEKTELETAGIMLSERAEELLSDELMFFYKSVSLPSERLTVSYCAVPSGDSRPSAGVDAVRNLFADLVPEHTPPALDLIFSAEEMRDLLPALGSGSSEYRAASELLAEDGTLLRDGGDVPLVINECSVGPDVAASVFGDEIRMNQSRLETFVECRFSYYCRYALGLASGRRVFDRADAGVLMHGILEKALSDDHAPEELDGIIEGYLKAVCPREVLDSARIEGLLDRLKKTSALLIKEIRSEFAQSGFKPAFFEYELGSISGNEPLSFDLPNGGKISISGIADRIDTFVRDGKAYVRVVDYKTGKKGFSLSDIKDGINLQLLLYLFSLWKNPPADMLKKLGADSVLPAGIMYFEARPPKVLLNSGEDTGDLEVLEQSNIKRSGLFLDDPDILREMDRDLAGRFIPVTAGKDGIGFASRSNLASLERFGQLLNEVGDTLVSIGEEMKSGIADARPKTDFKNGKNRPRCAYCEFYPVCRKSRKEQRSSK